MGLIYSSSDSEQLISALKKNLQSGKEASEQLKAGSQKVITAVNGKTLSGAAYTAGKGLFSELIVPTISKVTSAINAIEQELQTYTNADGHISSEGTLDEDKLNQQIATKKAMKASVDASAAVARALSRNNPVAKILDALLDVQNNLNRMSNTFEDDIRELQKKLEKLHQFSSQTNSLFSNSLSDMKIAMQGVMVLNNTIVNNDGTYQLPSGIDKSWFTENKKTSQAEFDALKKKINTDDLPTTKAEILRDYHWSTNSNMYVHNKTGKPSPEVTALYSKLVMAEHQPQENQQLAFFNEMLRTGKHPITGKTISEAERLNARIMMYALALQPFVGAWAMAQVPKSYQSSTAKRNNGTEVEKTVTYSRVQGGDSKDLLLVNDDGTLSLNSKWKSDHNLNVSTGKDHANYFQGKRPDSYVVEFEVPQYLDDLIRENAISQNGYKTNPLNQGGTAPKIVDKGVFDKFNFEGNAYELPDPINQWLAEYAKNAKVLK